MSMLLSFHIQLDTSKGDRYNLSALTEGSRVGTNGNELPVHFLRSQLNPLLNAMHRCPFGGVGMDKFTVVIPTFNEAENLPAITEALFALGIEGLDIFVVDDNSPDGTGQVADQLAVQHPRRFHVLHRQEKQGLGTAYLQGFRWALNHGSEAVIQMDADFSHSPSYIPEFLKLIPDYDVVVGSRYTNGGRLDDRWGKGRWLLSWWANSVWVRLLLGVKTRDATAGFKCWRRSALEKINLQNIRSNGYIFQVEMCYVTEKLGMRIKEIPIYFEDRRIGKSKMSGIIKIEAALRVFEIRWRYRDSSLLLEEAKAH